MNDGADNKAIVSDGSGHDLREEPMPMNETDGENDAPVQTTSFGDDLPKGRNPLAAPHQTRPLEATDPQPNVRHDSARLSEQIAAALNSPHETPAGTDALLAHVNAANTVPNAQIRLKPGTTRRKIAGTGVAAEPLVFQSELSEGLVEQWIDSTLGTNTHTKDRVQVSRALPSDGLSTGLSGLPPSGTAPGPAMPPPALPAPRRFPMRGILGAGALFFLALLAFGAYKLFGSGGLLANADTPIVPGPDRPGAVGTAAAYPNDVTILTTATKAAWLDTEITAFNAANRGTYHVTRLPLLESRDGMQAILNGKAQPVIFTPSSPVWIARLVQVWQTRHPGQQLADLDDPQAFRLLMRSPLVVLTTKEKAPFLRQVFHSDHPWARVRALSLGRERAPWGTFKFAHADPLDASSGMLTMSLILTEYAADTHSSLPLAQVAKSLGFHDDLTALEHSFVRDPNAAGSSALERAFTTDVSSRDFITAYESKAMGAVAKNPDLTVIYPTPTAVADQSAAVLNAPWVTPHERTAAIAFLDFLATPQAARDALKYDFRPVAANVSLDPQIKTYAGNGFQDSYRQMTLPDYDALNEAANQWRIIVHRN